jgi:hypothetical protein
MKQARLAIALTLVALAAAAVPARAQDAFDLAAPKVGGLKKLAMRLSQYSIVFAQPGSAVELLDPGDRPLGVKLSRADFCEAALQGTVEIGGRRYSVAGKGRTSLVDCSLPRYNCPRCADFALGQNRFVRVGAPGSDDNKLYGLVPYRTVAVRQGGLAPGTVLFIPAARGLKMPNGRRHDGYFFVADFGDLRSSQLDLYADTRKLGWTIIGSGRSGKSTAVYIVTDQAVIAKLRAPHLAAAKALTAQ